MRFYFDPHSPIWVEDTGPGIAAEEMGLVFEAFEQTAAGHRSGRGTGLGLAISRRIVQQHGGRLTAANRESGGAVFTVELPVNAADTDLENRSHARTM